MYFRCFAGEILKIKMILLAAFGIPTFPLERYIELWINWIAKQECGIKNIKKRKKSR